MSPDPSFAGKVPGKRTPPEKMEPRSILAKAAVAVFRAMDCKYDVPSVKNLLTKYKTSLKKKKSEKFDIPQFETDSLQ